MNTINHTPGPWTWPDDKPLLAADGHNVNGVFRTKDELRANRALISAAPDLLAALQAIVAALDETADPGRAAIYWDDDEAEVARQAISKATGKFPRRR